MLTETSQSTLDEVMENLKWPQRWTFEYHAAPDCWEINIYFTDKHMRFRTEVWITEEFLESSSRDEFIEKLAEDAENGRMEVIQYMRAGGWKE